MAHENLGPQSVEDWYEVALERHKDARAALEKKREVIAVYLAGYCIECLLKAFLKAQNWPWGTKRREGHNLAGLWKACRFRVRDLNDQAGHKTFFVEEWSTDLRYESDLSENRQAEALVKAAGQVKTWIERRLSSVSQKGRSRR